MPGCADMTDDGRLMLVLPCGIWLVSGLLRRPAFAGLLAMTAEADGGLTDGSGGDARKDGGLPPASPGLAALRVVAIPMNYELSARVGRISLAQSAIFNGVLPWRMVCCYYLGMPILDHIIQALHIF